MQPIAFSRKTFLFVFQVIITEMTVAFTVICIEASRATSWYPLNQIGNLMGAYNRCPASGQYPEGDQNGLFSFRNYMLKSDTIPPINRQHYTCNIFGRITC